ncbi:RecX family transcriptional regulator [Bacillus coahuilensis]|uniref:RecX family transcriptional regulator n=1 Tax=Bacillus coahuilensis TaxID=408580 RepID=UPI001ED91F9D|nr:RecX family transcriptional regulator [Bacillus coahuilensis]
MKVKRMKRGKLLSIKVKSYQRYSTKYTGYEYEQRMKQALYRKGFSIQEIERLLTQLKENESTF